MLISLHFTLNLAQKTKEKLGNLKIEDFLGKKTYEAWKAAEVMQFL